MTRLLIFVSLFETVGACGGEPAAPDDRCGSPEGVVARVIDGDTVVLADGRRVRYLLMDSPEMSTDPVECFAPEATAQNRSLVQGQSVRLEYDAECEDSYDRLLAYVYVGDRMINEVLVERGFGRVLLIAPNGRYEGRMRDAELLAQQAGAGIWGACQ